MCSGGIRTFWYIRLFLANLIISDLTIINRALTIHTEWNNYDSIKKKKKKKKKCLIFTTYQNYPVALITLIINLIFFALMTTLTYVCKVYTYRNFCLQLSFYTNTKNSAPSTSFSSHTIEPPATSNNKLENTVAPIVRDTEPFCMYL